MNLKNIFLVKGLSEFISTIKHPKGTIMEAEPVASTSKLHHRSGGKGKGGRKEESLLSNSNGSLPKQDEVCINSLPSFYFESKR